MSVAMDAADCFMESALGGSSGILGVLQKPPRLITYNQECATLDSFRNCRMPCASCGLALFGHWHAWLSEHMRCSGE